MKKVLTALSVTLISSTVCFAMMEETQTSNIDILRAQGYSESALKVIDIAKAHGQGLKYKKYYTTQAKGPYHRIKVYTDPIQDDDTFGEHQLNFANSWNGDETRYTSGKVPSGKVEDL